MTTVVQPKVDMMMVFVSAAQAVTILFVAYLYYDIKKDATQKEVDSNKKEIGSEVPITETRSVRGQEVYGPYKKVRRALII